jgi:hypothetical protein
MCNTRVLCQLNITHIFFQAWLFLKLGYKSCMKANNIEKLMDLSIWNSELLDNNASEILGSLRKFRLNLKISNKHVF